MFAFMRQQADLVHDQLGNIPDVLPVFDIPAKLHGLSNSHRIGPAQTPVCLGLCAIDF